jgi:hypothetical protein
MRIGVSPWWRLYLAGAVATLWFAFACSVWGLIAWRTGDLLAWTALSSQAGGAVVWCLFVVALRRSLRRRPLALPDPGFHSSQPTLRGESARSGRPSPSRRPARAVTDSGPPRRRGSRQRARLPHTHDEYPLR